MHRLDDGVVFVVLRVQDSPVPHHPVVLHDESRHVALDFNQRMVVAEREHAAPTEPEHRTGELRSEPVGDGLHLDLALWSELKGLHSLCVLARHQRARGVIEPSLLLHQPVVAMDWLKNVGAMTLVEDCQARRLQRGHLAAEVPEALHVGFEFPFATAGVAVLCIAGRIHRPAHQGQGVVDRYMMGRHAGIGNEKRSGGESCDSPANDMGVLVLDAFGG